MMNLVPFETHPLRRQEQRVHATTTTTTPIMSKDASFRNTNTLFDCHLDLSLSMSMSRGGSGGDATGCSGAKASESHHGGNISRDKVGCMRSGDGVVSTVAPANVPSAGHGHVRDVEEAGASWTSSVFMPSPTVFMHPWSLAARQQKAAAEQDRTTTAAAAVYAPSESHVIPLPSTVGWPPVHISRRNIITAIHSTKSDGTVTVDGLKGVTMPGGNHKNLVVTSRDSKVALDKRPPLNMFAKVYMEGYTIARKVNLSAHGSYDSLSRVLTKMTRNFFCHCSIVNTVEEDFSNRVKFIFLYEDFEGDRMLVGDVPWELFLASAKKLYITQNLVPGDKGHGNCDKDEATENGTKK